MLAGGGALIVSFSLKDTGLAQQTGEAQNAGTAPARPAPLPGSLDKTPMLDAWIRVDADGTISVFTGKAELGQGIKTALIQVAAEQLDVAPHSVHLVAADTALTPNEGYTAGSHSMQDSGTAIMHAAAQVREILLGIAAERLSLPIEQLAARDGAIVARDGRLIRYGELIIGDALHVRASPTSALKDPAAHRVIGTAMPRVDIPAKVTGGAAYVHDLRLPGMLHARVVRPPSYGARLLEVDTTLVERMPGVAKVIRDGSYMAVLAEHEFEAVKAMRALASLARWEESAKLPDQGDVFTVLDNLSAEEHVILDKPSPVMAKARAVEASFRRHYQMHGSIGPSCAVAEFRDGSLTVYSHAQGMYPLRQSIAEMMQLAPEQVRCIHLEGAGCYGHNGADDAAADAALIAFAMPGRPVRVQWMREQEHQWEPYGPAMITRVKATLDPSGKIVEWHYEVRSNTHSTRPPGAGQLMPAWFLSAPLKPSAPKPLPLPEGGGDRNAIPLYVFSGTRVVHQFVPDMPLRVSALRGLGAYMNVFSIESFMDELAATAGIDPVEFRLRHLDDARARDVIMTAAEHFGWNYGKRTGYGCGFAFARYKNLGAYAAIAAEVAVDRDTGRVRVVRAVAAVDSGEAVNPDGIRNQIEGGIVQSASWTLYEAVTFNHARITSQDWSTYPILGFGGVPDSVEVHVINRPGQPFLGTGEAAQGPAAAAIANAIRDATGISMRELPITPERVRAASAV
jgi:CO/xanthine dehydrogenase Mo-binding subunit